MEELGDYFKCKDIVPDILAEEERKYNREIANLRPILEGKTLVIMTPLIWRGLVSLRMNPPGVGSTRRVCFLPLRGCASNAYGSRLGANHLNCRLDRYWIAGSTPSVSSPAERERLGHKAILIKLYCVDFIFINLRDASVERCKQL